MQFTLTEAVEVLHPPRTGGQRIMTSRYDLAKKGLVEGEHLLCCTDCGALIDDGLITRHDKWHRDIDGAITIAETDRTGR